MSRQHLPLYAIALAIVIVGALAAGVPARSLAFGMMALACPLMMLFLHGGHGGHGADGADEGRGPVEGNPDVHHPAKR